MPQVRKVLFIQTAFIGDAILASALWEDWHRTHPEDELHICVRKGNETLFKGHPFLRGVHTWDKSGGGAARYGRLMKLGRSMRRERFDVVITPHRHASSGWLAWRSGASIRVAFDVHPLKGLFTHTVPHSFDEGLHETERNHRLIAKWTEREGMPKPRLYPAATGMARGQYAVLTPASQWATKQWPEPHWVQLCDALTDEVSALTLLGGPSDSDLLQRIAKASNHPAIQVVTDASLLESAGIISNAQFVVTNDSGPMHLASAVNVPTVAVFCSTVPAFGFGPLADRSAVVETQETLPCRPCGIHGKTRCPFEHFSCGSGISVAQVLQAIRGL